MKIFSRFVATMIFSFSSLSFGASGGTGPCTQAPDPAIDANGLSALSPRGPSGAGIVPFSQFTLQVCQDARRTEERVCKEAAQRIMNELGNTEIGEASIHGVQSVGQAFGDVSQKLAGQRQKCDDDYSKLARDCSLLTSRLKNALNKFESRLQGNVCDPGKKLSTAKNNLESAENQSSLAATAYAEDSSRMSTAAGETGRTASEARNIANDASSENVEVAEAGCVPASQGGGGPGTILIGEPFKGGRMTVYYRCMSTRELFVGSSTAETLMSCQANCR